MGREEKMASTQFVPASVCRATYGVAVGWVAFIFLVPHHEDPYFNGMIAHLEATVVIWLFSFSYGNTSLYDPAWCVLPIAVAAGWMCTAPTYPSLRSLYAIGLLLLWFNRYNTAFPWDGWSKGISAEDWRYADLAKKTGSNTAAYWALSLLSLHLTPTLLVWLPLSACGHVWWEGGNSTTPPIGWRDALAVGVTLGAIVIQRVAVDSLRIFRQQQYGARADLNICSSSKMICREGLWGFSRHPNYFGEACFWLGISILGWAGQTNDSPRSMAAAWGGAAMMFGFFRFSATLMDARMLKNRGVAYMDVIAEVSALVPWPPSKSKQKSHDK